MSESAVIITIWSILRAWRICLASSNFYDEYFLG